MRPPFKKHKEVNRLRNVHEKIDGWGTSAMREKMQSDVRLGRPFGGTGFMWKLRFAAANLRMGLMRSGIQLLILPLEAQTLSWVRT